MKPSRILLYGIFTTENTEKLKLETLDAIGEPSDVEIDQKSRLALCELHICKQLGLVNAFDFIDCFQPQYQLIINQNVYPVATNQPHTFILHRHRTLQPERYFIQAQFISKALLIC